MTVKPKIPSNFHFTPFSSHRKPIKLSTLSSLPISSLRLPVLLRVPNRIPVYIQDGEVRRRIQQHEKLPFARRVRFPHWLAIAVLDEVAVVLEAKHQLAITGAAVGVGSPHSFCGVIDHEVAILLQEEFHAVSEDDEWSLGFSPFDVELGGEERRADGWGQGVSKGRTGRNEWHHTRGLNSGHFFGSEVVKCWKAICVFYTKDRFVFSA